MQDTYASATKVEQYNTLLPGFKDLYSGISYGLKSLTPGQRVLYPSS